jgi:16S rRNA (guanine1207-N2)-methyltransferase
MLATRLTLALQGGALVLPDTGRILVLRPRAGDDLSALPRDRVLVATGFRPDFDSFESRGYRVTAALPEAPEAPCAAVVVCLPRARAAAQGLIAQAAAAAGPGGLVVVDGQKTDGIEPLLRALKGRLAPGALSDPLTKGHGRMAWFRAPAAPGLSDWLPRARTIDGGFVTLPGIFSADGPDRGSALLAAALPEVLPARVVDLGAGWGFLARAALARKGIATLDLVEAEAEALDCARLNIPDPRARFHWADATRWQAGGPVGAVLCNPPFHAARSPDPALGLGFLAAAARLLSGHGTLWLVANRHLPYDRALAEMFREVTEIGGDATFRLTRASQPRRAAAARRT